PAPDLNAGGVLAKYRGLLALASKLAATPKAEAQDVKRLAAEQAELLKGFDGKPFELAWLAFTELGKELQPSQERMRFVAQLLAAGPRQPQPPYEEIAFVQRLADWKGEAKDWSGRNVRAALQLVEKAAGVSALADDPRLLPWVRPGLKAAQASRQA